MDIAAEDADGNNIKPTGGALSTGAGLPVNCINDAASALSANRVVQTITVNVTPGPITITGPTSVVLGMPATLTASPIPCLWSITPAASGTITPTVASLAATYSSVGNEAVRFATADHETVTIKCTDPGNSNNSGAYTITVTYKPAYTSTNYMYSYAGKNNDTWYEAKATCEGWNSLTSADQSAAQALGLSSTNFPGLKEGGYTGWILQSKTNLISSVESSVWCSFVSNCTHMPGGAILHWATDISANQAYRVKYDGTYALKDKGLPTATSLGYRCVRPLP